MRLGYLQQHSLLLFMVFFRVGELTANTCNPNKTTSQHCISIWDVTLKTDIVEIYLRSSTTDQLGSGVLISIGKQPDSTICPLLLLRAYLRDHPNTSSLLFCHFDGSSLTRYQFTSVLKKALSQLHIDNVAYKSHSFLIGAATDAALQGMSDLEIQALGRWKSNAFRRYIIIQF